MNENDNTMDRTRLSVKVIDRFDLAERTPEKAASSRVPARFPRERVQQLVERLIDPICTGNWPFAQELFQSFPSKLQESKSDLLVEIVGVRAANAIEQRFGFTQLYEIQQISKVYLRTVPGIGITAVDKIEQELLKHGMKFAG